MSADYSYLVMFMSAEYRVHLHVFKKMQLQSSKSYVCDLCRKIQKETELKNVTCVSLFFQATSHFFVQGSMVEWEGDRVKERAVSG